MDNQLKSNGKGVSWRHSVWIFFKAQISAQFASFVDFLVTILLVKAFAVFYPVSYTHLTLPTTPYV